MEGEDARRQRAQAAEHRTPPSVYHWHPPGLWCFGHWSMAAGGLVVVSGGVADITLGQQGSHVQVRTGRVSGRRGERFGTTRDKAVKRKGLRLVIPVVA